MTGDRTWVLQPVHGRRWRADFKCSEVCLGKDWRCAADTRTNPPKAPEVSIDGTAFALGGVRKHRGVGMLALLSGAQEFVDELEESIREVYRN